jgi:hypothetical protein
MFSRKKKRTFFLLTVAVLAITGSLLAKIITAKNGMDKKQEEPYRFTDVDAKEVSSIFTRIDTAANILLEGSYELYDAQTQKPLEQQPFIIAKHNGSTYMLVGTIEQLFKDGKAVLIDNKRQFIAVDEALVKDTTASILKGFMEMKTLLDKNATSLQVTMVDEGNQRTVKFQGDSTGMYNNSEMVYDRITGKLKSSSVTTSVMMPGNEENAEKKVVLKMVVKQYENWPASDRHVLLNNKVKWIRQSTAITGYT